MTAFALGLTALAHAAPIAPYSKQAFVDAQNAGKPIVVFVHAAGEASAAGRSR
jgi:hypothetical protein